MHLVSMLMMSLMRSDQSVSRSTSSISSLHPDILHSYLANFSEILGRSVAANWSSRHMTRPCSSNGFFVVTKSGSSRKGTDQSSRLVASEEYKNADKSKDLQQDYLLGRFGGVPVIRDFSWLGEDHGKGT